LKLFFTLIQKQHAGTDCVSPENKKAHEASPVFAYRKEIIMATPPTLPDAESYPCHLFHQVFFVLE
jgi:hypothetical protein